MIPQWGRVSSVQTKEIPSVKGQHRPFLRDGKGQNIGILDSLIGSAGIESSQDIMT
jgi:hypothetical protein